MRFKNLLFSHYDDTLEYPKKYRVCTAVKIYDQDYGWIVMAAEQAMDSLLKEAIRPCLDLGEGRIVTITSVELVKQDNTADYYEIEVRIEEDNRRELEIKAEYFERENEKLRNKINELLFEKYESERFGE